MQALINVQKVNIPNRNKGYKTIYLYLLTFVLIPLSLKKIKKQIKTENTD